MKLPPLAFIAGCLALCPSPVLFAAEELLPNPGFEEESAGWNTFIPEGPSAAAFEPSAENPHGGSLAAALKSANIARMAILPKGGPMRIEPGKYQVKVWIRAGDDFHAPQSPGFVIRINLFDAGRNPVEELYRDWRAAPLSADNQEPIPSDWTEVTVPFEAPESAAFLKLHFFLWRAAGTLFLDDASLTRLD